MGRNLAGLAIIAAGVNAFLIVYAVGRLVHNPDYYTGYGAVAYFVTLFGVPFLASAMKRSHRQWPQFLALTVLVFGPLVFSMVVNYEDFPFKQTFAAVAAAAALYLRGVYRFLHT